MILLLHKCFRGGRTSLCSKPKFWIRWVCGAVTALSTPSGRFGGLVRSGRANDQRSHPRERPTQAAAGAHKLVENEYRRRFLKRDPAAFFNFVAPSDRSPMRSGAALNRLMPCRFSRIRIVSGNRERCFLPKNGLWHDARPPSTGPRTIIQFFRTNRPCIF